MATAAIGNTGTDGRAVSGAVTSASSKTVEQQLIIGRREAAIVTGIDWCGCIVAGRGGHGSSRWQLWHRTVAAILPDMEAAVALAKQGNGNVGFGTGQRWRRQDTVVVGD
ncbi:hypothetical protein NL676_038416 [Syzygium grande]|nr:hypothetical protein NL676_038416 [Syzygium grande]